ncbi:MAG: phage tail protein [bacterium]|jgi:hypothetical protein
MINQKYALLFGLAVLLVIGGAWAVGQTVEPQDFDPFDPNAIPQTTVVDVTIRGITNIGQVFMVEGLESETTIIVEGNRIESGTTRYPRLVLHGIFDENIRRWRDRVIKGDIDVHNIEIDLRDSRGRLALQVEVFNAFPVKFSLPPLSTDGSTRYMERLEFAYSYFELQDS